jgi:hypothetical protein
VSSTCLTSTPCLPTVCDQLLSKFDQRFNFQFITVANYLQAVNAFYANLDDVTLHNTVLVSNSQSHQVHYATLLFSNTVRSMIDCDWLAYDTAYQLQEVYKLATVRRTLQYPLCCLRSSDRQKWRKQILQNRKVKDKEYDACIGRYLL